MRSSTPQFFSKALVVLALVGVLGPARTLAQDAATANLNAISSVNVRGGTVEIVGTKKPNFTTFTLTDPPRLVIDISEAIFNGVAEDIAVNNGTVTAIRTASYGSDESAIARVLIGYEREVETDIQARGNSLVVSVAGAGGNEAVAAASTGTAPAATGTGTGTAATGTAATGTGTGTAATGTGTGTGTGTAATGTGTASAVPQNAAVTTQSQPSDEERLRQAAQAAKAAQEEQKQQQLAAAQAAQAAKDEQKQRDAATAQANQQARADAEAKRQAEARAESERKAQEESARVATAQAERERAQQAEQQRAQAQREAQVAEKQRQLEASRAEADARRESAAQAVENRKRQVAEERARREEEAQAAADARRQQAEEKQRLQQEEKQRQQEARQARVAQAPTPAAPVERGESSGPPSVSSRRKTMTLVGFRQERSASRVFVRTDEPVRYSISKGTGELVVELENTRITDDNNTLPLDTSFFNTSVASVAARPGPSRTVRVSIRLKQQVPYQTRQEGNELMIDFERPARR